MDERTNELSDGWLAKWTDACMNEAWNEREEELIKEFSDNETKHIRKKKTCAIFKFQTDRTYYRRDRSLQSFKEVPHSHNGRTKTTRM